MTNILLNQSITKQGFDNIHAQLKEQQESYIRLIARKVFMKRWQWKLLKYDTTEEEQEYVRLELHVLDVQMKGSKTIIQRKKQQLQVLEKYEKK